MLRIERFASALLERLPPHARVLEIGAGEGELAQRLADAGHDVVAIDPTVRSTFPVQQTTFEAFDAPPESFDAIVSQLVLHHVEDLDAAMEKAARLLRPGGLLAIDDYGWERSDDPAFRADRGDLHTSERMLLALRRYFNQEHYADQAYYEEGAASDSLGFVFFGRRS